MATDAAAVALGDSPLSTPARQASIHQKSDLVCEVGKLIMESGASSWRIHDAMERVGRKLGVKVDADAGIVNVECTVTEGRETYTQVVSVGSYHTNSQLISVTDWYVRRVEAEGRNATLGEYYEWLREAQAMVRPIPIWAESLAISCACGAFAILIGGGLIELLCAFVGAGCGMALQLIVNRYRFIPFLGYATGVASATIIYLAILNLFALFIPQAIFGSAGFVVAAFFCIPGFPIVTCGLDFFKIEMRGGVERMFYAFVVFFVSGATAWFIGDLFGLAPDELLGMGFDLPLYCIIYFIAAFVGATGFSVHFKSKPAVCVCAGVIGAIGWLTKFLLANAVGIQIEWATFLAALLNGLLAAGADKAFGFSRLSLTVPASVILIPGVDLYKSMYLLAGFQMEQGIALTLEVILIVLFIPLGVVVARAITDPSWRKLEG